jgi:aminoglycoside 3'-phosphotransferase-1
MGLVREEACAAVQVPANMSAAVAGYAWARNKVGQSGRAVYRLHNKAGASDLFLKHGTGAIADDITGEMVRLRWLARHIQAPAVECFVSTSSEAWLLMTAIPGETAYQVLEAYPDARNATVDALATFLGRLHAIPVRDCPFTSDHAHRLARARERIDAGLIEVADFDQVREGWAAEQVWEAMQRLLPLGSDPVVTHGDFSLDNIIMLGGEVVGCINAGRAGIADRFQDLAILWNDLGEFGPDLQDRLFLRYGITDVDRQKLQFYLLLDELF